MDEEEFIEMLQEGLFQQDEEKDPYDDHGQISSMRSFQEAMLLTRDKGFICKLSSGEEFQVTVVRSS